ncbi:MAG: ribosomal L7Ae/L30e/S12e/Gadd45 family protein [Acutalibacteraceae bacterium]|nr:ribosomal L7Ae/L30e/S12e/Gadd45 family protein [Acutalibacteraceae bacterium]
MQNKFLSLLGMARKANRVSLGYDKSLEAIHTFKSYAVFVANDISEKTKRGLVFAAEESEIEVITTPYSIFDFTNAVGTKTGIVSVNDSGFAKKLISLL